MGNSCIQGHWGLMLDHLYIYLRNSSLLIKPTFKMRVPLIIGAVLCSIFLCMCSPCCASSSEIDHLRKMMISQSQSLGFVRDAKWKHLNSKESFSSSMSMRQKGGSMEADKVDSLPGQQKSLAFNQYAGYVTVDAHSGRALFYYFVESPQDSLKKPLVLWLNGGPGCSSFGIGAMLELGPLRVNSDGETLYANEYAWNKVANIIFLESPAGVGFSYSNSSSDYESSGDKRTADDSYIFLINWLERFPQYKDCDFYITGESYAGHYVPELATTIIKNNMHINTTNINLKGIAIGNAYLDGNTNSKAMIDYIWTHALISDETHKAILSNCNFTSGNYSEDCYNAAASISMEIGNIDGYNIYAPLCHIDPKAKGKITSSKEGYDPCAESYVTTYLNLPEVQKALHANVTGLPYPWTACSGVLYWNDAPSTMLPTIKKLIGSGIRVWFYSGDLDAVCPVTSTRYFINMLHLTIQKPWRPWYTNKEVGGYVVGYEGLTFVTIRGAGHMVPINQPERALIMITSFLKGKFPPIA